MGGKYIQKRVIVLAGYSLHEIVIIRTETDREKKFRASGLIVTSPAPPGKFWAVGGYVNAIFVCLQRRAEAEERAREEQLLREAEQERLKELEAIKQELERLLAEERQAKKDEEIVRNLQAR